MNAWTQGKTTSLAWLWKESNMAGHNEKMRIALNGYGIIGL